MPPSEVSDPIARAGVLATLLASIDPIRLFEGVRAALKSLAPEDVRDYEHEFALSDGTTVGGIFLDYERAASQTTPLLIASFGFLQDRWGTEAAKFYDLYLGEEETRLPLDVLILDHPTSGPFYAANGNLSVGAYDDARMWLEVAQHARRLLRPSSIHLLGVSMSGQTVVHAQIEDRRLGLSLFDSGLAVSIAPDFERAPGTQLASLETPEGVDNPWLQVAQPSESKSLVDSIQAEGVWMLMSNQFLPNAERARPEVELPPLTPKDVPGFLLSSFDDRLARVRGPSATRWQ